MQTILQKRKLKENFGNYWINKMNRKAIIFGIKGTVLTNEEKKLLRTAKPWGIILFSRNIKNIKQLKLLILDIKSKMKDKKYPILIDQEGGKVSRLNSILDFTTFSQLSFGKLYKKNKKLFNYYYKIYLEKTSEILNDVGININTVPVLDVLRNNSHKIIGDRSFSKDVDSIKIIGSQCVKIFKKNKIGTVMKHIPGHGLALVDSHYKLPIVNASKNQLLKKDFKAFKNCNSFFAMTAHVLYRKYDPSYPATHSKILINKIIRRHIGFKGILISDDISMKALGKDLIKNATLALNSGCNIVLHCNGKINEMKKISEVIPKIDNFTMKKTSLFYQFLS